MPGRKSYGVNWVDFFDCIVQYQIRSQKLGILNGEAIPHRAVLLLYPYTQDALESPISPSLQRSTCYINMYRITPLRHK
jgi:hypothetical protein